MVVDIETTGFRRSDRILEIGICRLDTTNQSYFEIFNRVIRPPEFETGMYWGCWVLKNSTLTVKDIQGARPLRAYRHELDEIFRTNIVAAFNADFDLEFLRRAGFEFQQVAPDPMLVLTPILQLSGPWGQNKWPKFQEAWDCVFNHEIRAKERMPYYVEAHRAYDDALHEAMLINEMVKRGWYSINN